MALSKRLEWTAQSDLALGRRIAAARKSKGVSLETLAATLEISKATAGQWETGGRSIKHHDLARLCFSLEISADDLLFNRRIWPFDGIDADKVAQLEPEDVYKLQGAMLAVAAQLGVDITAVPREDSLHKSAPRHDIAHAKTHPIAQDGPSTPTSRGEPPEGAEWEKRFKRSAPKTGDSSTGMTTSMHTPKPGKASRK